MTLRRTLRLLVHFWLVTVVALSATAATGYLLQSRLHPIYQSDASLIVLSPSQGVNAAGHLVPINSFAGLGTDGLVITAHALLKITTTPAFHDQLVDSTGISDYTITLQPDGGGSIIDVEATARQGDTARVGVTRLMQLATQQLDARQAEAGAPAGTRFTARVLTAPGAPTHLSGGRLKVLAVVGALGLALTVALVHLAEYVRATRRRHPARRVTDVAVPTGGPHVDDGAGLRAGSGRGWDLGGDVAGSDLGSGRGGDLGGDVAGSHLGSGRGGDPAGSHVGSDLGPDPGPDPGHDLGRLPAGSEPTGYDSADDSDEEALPEVRRAPAQARRKAPAAPRGSGSATATRR